MLQPGKLVEAGHARQRDGEHRAHARAAGRSVRRDRRGRDRAQRSPPRRPRRYAAPYRRCQGPRRPTGGERAAAGAVGPALLVDGERPRAGAERRRGPDLRLDLRALKPAAGHDEALQHQPSGRVGCGEQVLALSNCKRPAASRPQRARPADLLELLVVGAGDMQRSILALGTKRRPPGQQPRTVDGLSALRLAGSGRARAGGVRRIGGRSSGSRQRCRRTLRSKLDAGRPPAVHEHHVGQAVERAAAFHGDAGGGSRACG